ncbi:hypothetical protein CMEL01_16699 [Colletotrichum melonis]|uniref:C2H2-type domain-containing protein n=1 Tax=Colletotrichum melonis TaxID=1209925 RepID=A0AAI9UCK6_9PEZI|nr:hypothetical protein CMEL01_16699 [Colletotrichum melonis]
MCFYRQSIWACGHWEWGDVVQHCAQDDLDVGGCQTKLVFAASSQPTECAACCQIFQKGIQLEALRSRAEGTLRAKARPSALTLVVRDMDKLHLELLHARAGITSQGLIHSTGKGQLALTERTERFLRCHWCGVQFHREEHRTHHILIYHQTSQGQWLHHPT